LTVEKAFSVLFCSHFTFGTIFQVIFFSLFVFEKDMLRWSAWTQVGLVLGSAQAPLRTACAETSADLLAVCAQP